MERGILDVVREHTAGNPQYGVIWTDLQPREIAQAMTQQVDARVSMRTVRQLLKRNGFSPAAITECLALPRELSCLSSFNVPISDLLNEVKHFTLVYTVSNDP
ncbi:hypothetical protein AWB78_07918 [Caballeronia calidae]|uniref:Winged helix-turn helix domain-containing protein n=1 Tax=Caballeronia calidae TaxID=1777139 RepID=A0A158EIF4_9BURK|nr:hypothetical protein [Caballeronia calidae]SAL06176.1 hypothetical protein AWB78_07918 [Caballeronia calidae]